MRPLSLAWFARHEMRLAWRDTLSMMTAGRRERERKIAIGFLIFVGAMHLMAYAALGGQDRIAPIADLPTLIAVTSAVLLSGSAMLSQAMEAVTRSFYTRSDLELILSSPAPAQKLFAVRIGAMALSVSLMSVVLIGPFIDVLAWQGGPQWLGGYGVILAVSLIATSLAIILTVKLFEWIGPKRTRPIAQIAAAVIGGCFVVGMQIAAIVSTGSPSRATFLKSDFVQRHVPVIDSPFWWPARGALGDWRLMLLTVTASFAIFLIVTAQYAPRFANFAVAASGTFGASNRGAAKTHVFRVGSPGATLRRKERLLLIRDPWLISQSLMQVLYLLPAAVLLWQGSLIQGSTPLILVPVLVMAAGQLAGGLAWLTISGEDAPDLVTTSPIAPSRIWRAKIAAVIECIAAVFLPFVIALMLLSPQSALIAGLGIAAAALSSSTIQFWFRSQAKRSQFRRRHTSSRIATFAEAFSSVSWAATSATAAAAGWVGGLMAVLPLGILLCARLLSPATARKN
jgi:ABC-2 type transport system permease protein